MNWDYNVIFTYFNDRGKVLKVHHQWYSSLRKNSENSLTYCTVYTRYDGESYLNLKKKLMNIIASGHNSSMAIWK